MVRTAAITLLLSTPAMADELLLKCDGTSLARLNTSTTTADVRDSNNHSATGEASTTEAVRIPFQVMVRIKDGTAQMNVPGLAAPEINDGKAGWFPVKSLIVSDDEITGKVRFNLFASSTFRVDRRTGAISTSGGYTGSCVKQDLSQRAF